SKPSLHLIVDSDDEIFMGPKYRLFTPLFIMGSDGFNLDLPPSPARHAVTGTGRTSAPQFFFTVLLNRFQIGFNSLVRRSVQLNAAATNPQYPGAHFSDRLQIMRDEYDSRGSPKLLEPLMTLTMKCRISYSQNFIGEDDV